MKSQNNAKMPHKILFLRKKIEKCFNMGTQPSPRT